MTMGREHRALRWLGIAAMVVAVLIAVSPPALAAPTAAPSASPLTDDELQRKIDGEIQRLLDSLDVSALQQQLDNLTNRPDALTSARQLVGQLATGQFHFMGSDILQYAADSLKAPLRTAAMLFAELVLLLVVSGVLSQLMKSFTAEGAAKIASLTVYAAAALLVFQALRTAITLAQGCIASLLNVSQGIFPILSILLTATGGIASSAVLTPAYAFAVESAAWMTREILIPAAVFGSVMAIAGNMTGKSLLGEFGGLLRNGSVWIAGAVMTIFVAISSIQSSAAVSYDGISFRAAKYAIDSMIPYVGGMFSDLADTFVGCSLLVRNAVGLSSLLCLVLVLVPPLLTVLSTWLAFRLAAAAASALDSKQLSSVFQESAKVLVLLCVVMLMAFAMLFILTTITINAGNSILAMR